MVAEWLQIVDPSKREQKAERRCVRPPGYDARMSTDPEDERIIAEATAVLPGIVAALDAKEQPVDGSWVAFAVHGGPAEAMSDNPEIHRCRYTWHCDAPLEALDEAAYMELTRDAKTHVVKVPVWAFHLTPLAAEAWRLGYWFGAPAAHVDGDEGRRPGDGQRPRLPRASHGRRMGAGAGGHPRELAGTAAEGGSGG